MDEPSAHIASLRDLDDFQIADGDPDVRGWQVLAAEGRKIGVVDDLLIDTAAMKVRYLDVEIDSDLLEGDTERHILLPIGYARLDEDDDRIFADALDHATLERIPDYRGAPVTSDYSARVDSEYGRGIRGEDHSGWSDIDRDVPLDGRVDLPGST